MDAQTRGIITLLRSGLTGERLTLPEGFHLEAAMHGLYLHQIQPVCYIGAVNCGLDKKLPAMQKLFSVYCGVIRYCEQQKLLLEQLFASFDREGIDYMPLKGVELKSLYPSPELRTMGDADILIRMEQYPRIRPIMEGLGYERGKESDHELLWKKGVLIAELHKRLIPSYNKDFNRYFGDGWQLARLQEGTRYAMGREDAFVYLFTHFAKHYRDGGIGCRQVGDLWLYLKRYELDHSRLEREFSQLHLLEFYHNIRTLLRAWFEDGPWDDKTAFITGVILASGSWGGRHAHFLASAAKRRSQSANGFTAKIKRLWGLIFQPHLYMKQKYPVLGKWPVLLPVFWVVRVVSLLFTKGKLSRYVREYSHMTEQRMSEYEQALRYVGLEFNFEE